MPRARSLKHGYFTNETLAEVAPLGRILFAGLWTIADREGRLEDRPRKIKAEVLPYDDCNVDKLLSELAARDFIRRYEVSGTRYVQITSFHKHQNPHVKESPSLIPAPDSPGASTSPAPCKPGKYRNEPGGLLTPDSGLLTPDSSGSLELAADAAASKPEAILEFPVVGDPSRRTWPLTQAKLDEYREAYPSLDVEAEMRKALQWLRDHPQRQKTSRGIAGYLSSWLGRTADRARPEARNGTPQRALPAPLVGARAPEASGIDPAALEAARRLYDERTGIQPAGGRA